MVQVLLILIYSALAAYICVLGRNVFHNLAAMRQEKGSYLFYSITSAVVMFFSTFGVSDTAITVFIYKITKKVDDKIMPGTIIAGSILPVGAMAIAFLSSISVDPVTLAACVAAQTAGALIGVKVIEKLDGHMIRRIMSVALIATALLILVKLFFLGFSGGSKTSLGLWQLIITMIAFFVFGGLNMIGMGATVPNMAVLLLMGMNVKAVFPVVMAGNIISCCFGGFKFVTGNQYTRKAAVCSVFGVLGVLAAVNFVKNMNVQYLQIVMVGLLAYSAASMIYEECKSAAYPIKM